MPKKYQDKEGNFYDAILYTGYNAEDVIEFLENRPIVFLNNRPIVYSYSLFSDQYNDGTSKTYIDIKIDFNNTEDHIYLFTYEYLVYDIKKKYYYTYKPEIFDKNFKEVEMVVEKPVSENKDMIEAIGENQEDRIEKETQNTNNVISILGTDYCMFRYPDGTNEIDSVIQGMCDVNLKQIKLLDTSTTDRYKDKPAIWKYEQERHTLHHEIVHAYLSECGLLSSCNHTYGPWAQEEEIVDWIAYMNRKITKTFDQADIWLINEFETFYKFKI